MTMTRREAMAAGGTAAVALLLMARFGWEGGAGAAEGHFAVTKPDAAWRKQLSRSQYAVLRKEATEAPGSSPLLNEHRAGTFTCAGCAQKLFSSKTKFDSGTGWPSFWQPLAGAVGEANDDTLGFTRTEVHCARCGGHLGHKFDDGPKPTGLRYCMNGVAMRFTPGAA